MKRLLSMAAALIASAGVASAQEAGDAAAGKALAEQYCSECHNIAAGGAFKLYPPSFASIAAYYEPDIIRLRIMHTSNVLMPEFYKVMTPENREDLTAFILSLE